MMTVAEVMTRHVEFVAPGASAQDAAALMGELDVSSLPVGSADGLQGVITDRDLLYRVVAEGKDPRQTRVADVATRLVFTCRAEDPVTAAMDLMAAHNIRRLPVLDGERVVGWLTLSDLARRLLVDSAVVQAGLREIVGGGDGTAGRDATSRDGTMRAGSPSRDAGVHHGVAARDGHSARP